MGREMDEIDVGTERRVLSTRVDRFRKVFAGVECL